jgi:hypothetical protein
MTTTTTIATFPTRKETEQSTAGFADIHVYERYYQDRLRCENMVCHNLDKSLNGIPGRSAARTKLEKINMLMAQDFMIGADGIIYEKSDPRVLEAVAPIVPEETADIKAAKKATAVLMDIVPKVVSIPLTEWAEAKKANPRAIVLVEDITDRRCLITYAGDALILGQRLHHKLDDVWFGDQSFDLVRIGKTALEPTRLRLKHHGFEVIVPQSSYYPYKED